MTIIFKINFGLKISDCSYLNDIGSVIEIVFFCDKISESSLYKWFKGS